MDFTKLLMILGVVLLTCVCVQPVVSEITLTPDNPEKDNATSFYNNGDLLVAKGDYANAIVFFDMALASNTTMIQKTNALLYLYRDKTYAQIQLENYTGALTTLDTGLAQYPGDAMLWNNKGYALYRLGKMQDALAAYDSALSFDRNYTTAYINRGDALIALGKYSDAVAAFTRANETDPGNAAALKGISVAEKAEEESARTTIIVLAVIVVVAAGALIWYIRLRKPAETAAPEKAEKEPPSQQKKKNASRKKK